MRHGNKIKKIGRTTSHRKALLNNLATSLFLHGYIETTLPKAKALRPFAEKLITKAIKLFRSNSQARRVFLSRQIQDKIKVKEAYYSLISEWALICQLRQGGFLRIYKLGKRKGDNAPMAYIGIVIDEAYKKKLGLVERAPKNIYSKYSEEMAEFFQVNKNILIQWYHFQVPKMEIISSTTRNKNSVKFTIIISLINEFSNSHWPIYQNRYLHLPLDLWFDVTLNQSSIGNIQIISNDYINIIPKYSSLNIVSLLISPMVSYNKVEIEGVITFGKINNNLVSLSYVDTCNVTIKGPIDDLYMYNFKF